MTDARPLRRHRAYFHGWAQAFGHHDLLRDPAQGLRWLLGEAQLGLMLDPSVRTRLRGGDDEGLGGLLADTPLAPAAQPPAGQHPGAQPPAVQTLMPATASWPPRRRVRTLAPPAVIDVGTETLRLGRLTLRRCPAPVMATVRALLSARSELHLYETYHLLYPSGTRILTLSQRAPLGLIYRELAPALIRSAPLATPVAPPLPEVACA